MVGEAFLTKGIRFQSQAQICRWTVDFLLDGNLVVEVDGDYWHGLPGIRERDDRKNEDLVEGGFEVIRISESSVKEDINEAIEPVLKCIKAKKTKGQGRKKAKRKTARA
jgi:very-short-patch-repair endonuclease